ncbi:spore coat protein [Paenibacillus filicis]|uniref:Spore coat protein n=1 Tax=Paenibacillus filicis TaxID=669464 RepID=A0ABU9DI52_9BACL
MNANSNLNAFMPDGDLLHTILADLKRTCREYTTAATEANCPAIRQLFTHLLNETLQLQGRLYQLMQQHNLYSTSSSALRQEIDKQVREYAQTAQETAQFVQSKSYNQGFQVPPAFTIGQGQSGSATHYYTS